MKPRNKLQRRVLALSLGLPVITKVQKEWAFKSCLEHKGFANKSSAACLDCGHSIELNSIKRKRAICPSCDVSLRITKTRKSTDKQHTFFAIAEIVEEFQVIRNFELIAYYKKGKAVRHFLQEILQYWVSPEGKTTMVGRCHNMQGYCDSWGGDWSIRIERGYYHNKYDVYPRFYYPKSKFKKEYLKFGINHRLRELTFLEAIVKAPNNSRIETLLKAKRYKLAYKLGNYELNRFWPSIKICLRNKYKIKDVVIWVDYLELLDYFNKDLHNAKYVCPKNLKKEHDRLVEKKRTIQRRQKLEKQRRKIAEDQLKYEKEKSKFFGIVFSEGDIVVKVLEHVKEFLEEGDVLKHCLFANKYYEKHDSLILSARINDEPIETIEFSLSKMKVVQSRGLSNVPTKHNKKIINLIERNKRLIEKTALVS